MCLSRLDEQEGMHNRIDFEFLFLLSRRRTMIGEELRQGFRQMIQCLIRVQISTDFQRIQKFTVDQIRQAAVLSQGTLQMTFQQPVCTARVDRRVNMRNRLLCVFLPEIGENRTLILFFFIRAVFEHNPEQILVHALIHKPVEGFIEIIELAPVIMFPDRTDDAVPIQICASLIIIDSESRVRVVILRGVPDQVQCALFLKICDLHICLLSLPNP